MESKFAVPVENSARSSFELLIWLISLGGSMAECSASVNVWSLTQAIYILIRCTTAQTTILLQPHGDKSLEFLGVTDGNCYS